MIEDSNSFEKETEIGPIQQKKKKRDKPTHIKLYFYADDTWLVIPIPYESNLSLWQVLNTP